MFLRLHWCCHCWLSSDASSSTCFDPASWAWYSYYPPQRYMLYLWSLSSLCYLSFHHLSPPHFACLSFLSLSIPKTIGDALSHPRWRQAMIDEINTLQSSGTWELVPLPSGKSVVGCRCIFLSNPFDLGLTGLILLFDKSAWHVVMQITQFSISFSSWMCLLDYVCRRHFHHREWPPWHIIGQTTSLSSLPD